VNHTRPKNLNLFTIKFPIPAIVSILHRASGAFLFLLIPFLLWGLNASLTPEGFGQFQMWFDATCGKLLLLALLTPFCYHFIAGIRHLLMDIHIGSKLNTSRCLAWLTFVFTILLLVIIGIWIW